MKKIVLLLIFISGSFASAQSFDFQYDHYSFIVKDLDKVGSFYKNVLNLKEIPHPSDTTNFKWFIVNGNSQLHLIRKDSVAMEHSKSVHLCLATQKLEELITYLEENNVTYWDWPGKENSVTLRADGVRQIYLKDPENNWVEINNAVH
ncbi:Glyoxalase-like domain-containing protein [Maribacter orientalis]|uniref:Glyoxalase-like domain-containing protein n=1 Tax=Maribacter orientalis TaxID=228957 RepID=A0A1H7UKN9_9FLAO|nr:VOC family protein [Maribacter orientalis]SEL97612.1 Glyoxalase-like domain-containing protein [Maribacter orientalis]|tara:strand:- start:1365 stop:1808 length:444 start_codon:yes stop_codon:yes gene_type:complete